MNPYHLLWIVPLVGCVGYLFGVTFNSSSERELSAICKRCWHKWEMGIQQSEPGLRRELDVNINEDV
jgi:hypothetical protein